MTVWPQALWWVGRALAALSLALALVWWGSMAWAAWQGRLAMDALVAPGIVLGLVSLAPLHLLRPHRSEQALPLRWRQDWLRLRPEDAHWGAAAQSPWRDSEGLPVILQVMFDLGPWLIVRTQGAGQATVRHHWVKEPDPGGPWRWRLLHSGPPRDALDALVASSSSTPAPARFSSPSTHAIPDRVHPDLHTSSDFPPTQPQENDPWHLPARRAT